MNINRSLVFGLVMLSIGTAVPAFGDVQSSVRRLLPATVAVQWTGHTSTDLILSDVLELTVDAGGGVVAAAKDAAGEVSLSSGTVVAEDGLIVTAHLSREPGDIQVIWQDGRRESARIVVDDRRTDLQLLRVDADDLVKAELRQDAVELAQQVVTVTCTDVRERAAGTGIVTALNQSLGGKAADVLRTDIPTGPMSAGAPLGDMEGRVAGIIIAKRSETTREDGPALVVPSAYAQALLSAYNPASEEVVVLQRGWLGIQLNDDDEEVDHPFIVSVFEKSPAKVGKLQEGDKILKVRDEKPKLASDVVRILGYSQPGEDVDVLVVRDGAAHKLTVTLGDYPESEGSDYYDLTNGIAHRLLMVDQNGKLIPYNSDNGLDLIVGGPQREFELKERADGSNAPTPETLRLYSWIHPKSGAAIEKLELSDDATIRVFRSDVEEQLTDVSAQVKSLAEQVSELAKALEKLNAKLKE